MNIMKTLLILACVALAPAMFAVTSITSDITTDTTWNASGSPYELAADITIRNGATLTIDSSSGGVTIEFGYVVPIFGTDIATNLQIGNGSGDEGFLEIKAASGQVRFAMWVNSNVTVNAYGRITTTDSSAATIFENSVPGIAPARKDWGAIDFEAGQTYQSYLANCDIEGGGFDGKDGALVVRNTETNTPLLEDLTFDDCNVSAIRFDGQGINTLRQDGLKGPLAVTNTDYVFNLQTVDSTTSITFPDVENSTTPKVKVVGNVDIGQSGKLSHWRFADTYTFDVSSSVDIDVDYGSIWGTEENRPLFQSISGSPTETDWDGIHENINSQLNLFGGIGPFAFIEVHHAANAFYLNKGTTIPQAGQHTERKFPGLVARDCDRAFRVRTGIDTDTNKSGFSTIISEADFGGTSASTQIDNEIIRIDWGRVVIENCELKGSRLYGVYIGATNNSDGRIVTIRDSSITDTSGTNAVYLVNSQGDDDVTIERTRISGYTNGVRAYQKATYEPTRTILIRHSSITGNTTGLYFDNESTNGVYDINVEDCTVSACGTRGLYGYEVRANSTVSFLRTNFISNTQYGVYIRNNANNTCEYTFEQCAFFDNGNGSSNRGGIRDPRTFGSKVVVHRSSFIGNNPRGATDNNNTVDMDAEDNYWGAEDGPDGSGPGTGDDVNANVDYDPFLARPFFSTLIGGSPASAANLDVLEDASTDAENLHVVDKTPYFTWDFAKDFGYGSQSAYELQVDDDADFSSTLWATSKTVSTSNTIGYSWTALVAGSVYYLRARLWNEEDVSGPWSYLTFKMNSKPATVSDTNRVPTNSFAEDYAAPTFGFDRPADGDEDPLHFDIEIDDNSSFNNGGGLLQMISSSTSTSMFEMSTDAGTTWIPFPADGCPAGDTIKVRYNPTIGLSDDTWYWRVRASDGHENADWSTTFNFVLTTEYVFTGSLKNSSGIFVGSGKVIKIARNGSVLGSSGTTNIFGAFTITTNTALVIGEPLVFFFDIVSDTDLGKNAARVVQFTGVDMIVSLQQKRAYVDQTSTDPMDNSDLADDDGVDGDIPWAADGSNNVTFDSNLDGSGNGVFVYGTWDMDANVTWGASFGTEEFNIDADAHIIVSGTTLAVAKLDNSGKLEVNSDGTLNLGTSGTTSGTLEAIDSTIEFQQDMVGVTLTQTDGHIYIRNSVLDDISTSDSYLDVTGGVLACFDSEFNTVLLKVGTAGIVTGFNGNSMDLNLFGGPGAVFTLIKWETQDTSSLTVMRDNSFDYSLVQGSAVNVESTTGSIDLTLVGSSGAIWGEGYDKDGGTEGDTLDDKVLWEMTNPTGLKITLGDARNRLEWDDDPQTDLANVGYNVYRSTTGVYPFTKINGSLVTTNSYNDSSLSNGTLYYYYVTVLNTNPATDVESASTNQATGTPLTSSIEAVSPDSTDSTSVLAMTVLGTATHWEASTTVAITGGTGTVTVNDETVISPYLVLVDVTLTGAQAMDWTVTLTENDVWGIAAYDEVETSQLTVNANDGDVEDRPTLAFTTNNSGIAADANTSGSFIFNIDFTDNGNGIDTTNLEIYASRDVTLASANKTAGTELIGAGLSIDSLDDTDGTCTINQTAGTELFADGEYTLSARVQDDEGNWSEWASIRFYVEGAASDVAIVADSGGDPVFLIQGTTQTITVTGTSLSSTQTIDFGTGITVDSATGSGASITVTLTTDNTADCGPRTFTTNNGAITGLATVQYPTNILPTVTNAEPSRNPGIAGINVFLANGAFFKSETDIATRGRMMGMSWGRFYRSDIGYNGPLGQNWVGHYFQRAIIDSATDDIWWYTDDGRKEVFTESGGSYSNPAGVYITATSETTHNTVTLTDRHGFKCVFNSDGRLAKCVDRNGNESFCTYNYAGQLTTITDDRAKTWEVEYYSHGRVQKVIDKVWDVTTPREIEYGFDSDGDLTTQKAPETARYDDAGSNRTTYGYRYDDEHKLTACINPREFEESSNPVAYMEIFYDDEDRVIDQRLGSEADVQDTHIAKSAFIRLRYESSTLIREIDRAGHRTDYTIDASKRITDVERFTAFWSVDTDEPIVHATKTEVLAKLRSTDPTSFDTAMTYNTNHEVLTVLYPRGNKVAYTYAGWQIVGLPVADSCSGRVLTDVSQSWTVNEHAGKWLKMDDSAQIGSTGVYAYYPIESNTSTTITVVEGFSLSEDGWDADTYSIHDENESRMAAGNVMETRHSDEGLGALADIVTTYTYEPRFQFVKTMTDPRGEVYTYTYDYEESAANGADAGNLVKTTSPDIDAGQTATQVITSRTTYNEYGQPVTSTDGEGNVSRVIYYDTGDSDGFVYQSIRAYGELDLTSEYEYDKVGNLTASYSPRAFEAGATKNDYKSTVVTNELNQSWHSTRKYEVGDQTSSSLVDVDSYSYFDLNGNRTQSFREYITDAGTAPTAPSDEDDPDTFTKSASAMAATWVESSAKYNLLNYGHESTVDAIAGSTVTRYTSRSEFDSNYNRIASISPLGNRSRVILDERDLTFQSISGADSDVQGTFEVDYDSNGNTVKSRDALGNESTVIYDGFDRTTKSTDAAGHYREADYDANSNVTESRAYDSLGTLLAQSQTTFDEINRGYTSRSLANDHLGVPIGDGWNTRVSVLDKNSRTVTSTNDNGVAHSVFYDAANRTTFSRDAVGNESHMTYNAHSAVTRVDYREINGLNGVTEISHTESILNRSDVAWEQRDRRWTETTFDTSGYSKRDGWGRVTEAVDAEDNSTTVNYDLLSRTTDTIREAGTEDIYTNMYYDDDSRTIQRAIKRNPIDSLYQETDYSYDERNRMITLRRPDGDIWTFNFDENSNRTGWTDPLGTAVTDTFDVRNLVEYRNIELGTGIVGTDYESYEFDGLGRLTASSNYADGDLISASAWAYNTQSAPERHDQTIADYEGSILGTWTTKSEYDESGFNTATIYSDGRTVRHSKDQLDRLLTSYDETNNVDIANYLYRGPRAVVERTFGNGTRTSFTYEASGCGCGGSTGYIENVEHKEISNDRVLWATERRYDKRGLVTVERRTQEANYGEVHRFDEAGRLTKTFFGADISGTLIDNYDNKGGTDTDPTIYGLRRDWDLDPRGNRTTVKDYDDAFTPVEVYDYSYTENEDTNEYTSIDGNSYSYDEIEQLTDDPTRNLDFEYDYKGQVITEDRDGDSAGSPERQYSYDNQGRRRTEQRFYEASYHWFDTYCMLYDPVCATCGCSNTGAPTLETLQISSSSTVTNHVQSTFGPGAVGGLSGSASHPANVATARGGKKHGPVRVFDLVNPDTGDDKYQYRYEDQLGSLIGMGDEDGTKLLDYVYLDYGRPIERQIAFDGDHDLVDEGNTTHGTPDTTIRIYGGDFDTDEFKGMQLAVMDSSTGDVYLGTVQSNTFEDIVVDDLEQGIIGAITIGDLDFVIYDLVDTNVATSGAYHTAGEWTSAPTQAGSGTSSRTTLTDTGADFQSHMVGWMISLTAEEFSYVEITDYVSATQIKVKGDARGLADDEGRYWVIAPPHIEKEHGTIDPDALCYSSKHLWAGYEYIAPMAGFYVDPDGAPALGVYGRQTGSNQVGWYYAWNRTYDSHTGRWTTPDPAASPWSNLQDYVGGNPVSRSDPSGLVAAAVIPLAQAVAVALAAATVYCLWNTACREAVIRKAKEAWRVARKATKRLRPDVPVVELVPRAIPKPGPQIDPSRLPPPGVEIGDSDEGGPILIPNRKPTPGFKKHKKRRWNPDDLGLPKPEPKKYDGGDCPPPGKDRPRRGKECEEGMWRVKNCGRNGDVKKGCPGWTKTGYGATRGAAQRASLKTLPDGCNTGPDSYHHCTVHQCRNGKWYGPIK